jgi:hypothetical protein
VKLTDTPAGYSGKPLLAKLGIKEGFTICIINQPENYFDILGELPAGVTIKNKLSGELNFIHFFTKSKKELSSNIVKLKKHLSKKGMLWVSWPKKSSKIPADITEDTIREIALPIGLVDIKVCAVNDNWSGLKLVNRVKFPVIATPSTRGKQSHK